MNDIAKTSISDKLSKALEQENIRNTEAGKILGVHPNYVSMIKREQHWPKCPASAWESTLLWINSGQTLSEYAEKHGKFIPTPHVPRPGTVISHVIDRKAGLEVKQERIPVPAPGPYPVPEKITPEKYAVEEARLKIVLDIDINLVINGKRITL